MEQDELKSLDDLIKQAIYKGCGGSFHADLWTKLKNRYEYMEHAHARYIISARALAHGLIDVLDIDDPSERKEAVLTAFMQASQTE